MNPRHNKRAWLGLASAMVLVGGALLLTNRADGQAAPPTTAKPQAVGENATTVALPELELPDLQGNKRNLAEWQGKVVLLNFWASWCPPCQYETPDLVRYQQQHGASGLQVIGVGLDTPRRLKNFQRTFEMNYPILVAGERLGAKLLNEWGDRQGVLPYSVVISTDGRIVYSRPGIFDDDAFAQVIQPLLGNNTVAGN